MKDKDVKSEKVLNFTSSLSGTMGFLGGWQVCHNLCLWVITALSLIGITIVGMPLLFLTKVAIPFWIAAVILFLISLIFYFKMKCISKNLLLFNGGIIVAGVPFRSLNDYSIIFWIIGGILIALSLISYLKEKFRFKGK